MSEVTRVALAARVFTVAAIVSIALAGDLELTGLIYVSMIATLAAVLSVTDLVPEQIVVIVEGALTAGVAAAGWPMTVAAMPYLATPALIGGVSGGLRRMTGVLLTEATAMAALWYITLGDYNPSLLSGAVTWFLTGIGLGLLGTFTRRNLLQSSADAPYRSALELIKQLHALSGKLTSGLDPVDLADQMLRIVRDHLVIRQAAVVIRTANGDFTPLRYSAGAIPISLDDADHLLHRCWQSRAPILETSRIALPVMTESERIAVILADCVSTPDPRDVEPVMERLHSEAVRLNAALLFSAVRESATREERQRLAREVHDGVAQDVASLGYLVDNLASVTTDPGQAEEVARLRREVTRVVTELRNSVFDLRNETGSSQGLGQSIASFARHVGAHSPLTVHVTLDEAGSRLRARVESELLRITQEAINNARRHSGGQNLWVSCRVHPPQAAIDVIDDGDGLGTAREDSHGVKIMRERAERVGARVDIVSPARDGRGTRVSVRLT